MDDALAISGIDRSRNGTASANWRLIGSREPRNLQAAFKYPDLPNDPPRYVVRPADTECVVAVGKGAERHSVPMRWGLVLYWAKDIKDWPHHFFITKDSHLPGHSGIVR